MKIESIDGIYAKIKEYIAVSNEIRLPFFINVNNQNDFFAVKEKLLEILTLKRVSSYCRDDDCFPDMDIVFSELRSSDENLLLVGFTQHIKILDLTEMRSHLGIVKNMSVSNGKLIILCFQFQEQLIQFIKQDKRLDGRVLLLNGEADIKPRLVILNSQSNMYDIFDVTDGYKNYLYDQEDKCSIESFVSSKIYNADFTSTCLAVNKISSSYQVLTAFFSKEIIWFSESWGKDENWNYLLSLIIKFKTINRVIANVFENDTNIKALFYKWKSWNDDKKWLFFISIKLTEINDSYLSKALNCCESADDLVTNLYRKILDYDHTDISFESYYSERKELITYVNDIDNIITFCKMSKIKGQTEIYYLTDISDIEKQEIISCLNKIEYLDDSIVTILHNVYPDLEKYLNEYFFDKPFLDTYFQKYKYQKVNNKILPDFKKLVNEYAKNRPFNMLPTRNEKFEKIDTNNAIIYFIDALGVEFLGYITTLCNEYKLKTKITICRGNLPSVTFYNKDFLKGFAGYKDIKDLDKLKHAGEGDYNYESSKLPIHIPKELEIIKEIIEKIKVDLSTHKKVIIVSDHGASRLVVINENKYTFTVQSNGTHGGRCCIYSKDLPCVDYATIENNQYVLASYDRFDGGHAARVETHGGATLEEVVVPIIEITRSDYDIEVKFVEAIIQVSFKKKAVLQLFSTKKMIKPVLKISNHFYAEFEENNGIYTIPIMDIKRAGTYTAEVYDGDNLIKKELIFIVKKEGSSENELL